MLNSIISPAQTGRTSDTSTYPPTSTACVHAYLPEVHKLKIVRTP